MTSYKTLAGCMIFVVLWSSGWIGSKYGQDYAGTFTLLAYRYVIVVALLFAFVSYTQSWRSIPRSQFLLHICVGVLSHTIFLGSGNSALDLGVSAGIVAFITALQPMITATMSSSVAGESASYRQWLGLTLGVGAIMLVVYDKISLGGSPLAYSLPFIAIVALSLASLLDRRISLQNKAAQIEPTPLSLICLIHCSSALVAIVPLAAFSEGFQAQWGSELVFSIIWLAVVVSLGAYGMMFFMLRLMSAIRVASLGYLAPPTTMFIAYFMFGERLSFVDLGGVLLAGIAVWLVVAKPKSTVSLPEPTVGNAQFTPSFAFEATAGQGLVPTNYKGLFSGHALDIELEERSANDSQKLADQYQQPDNSLFEPELIESEQAGSLVELLKQKNQEIRRLNQVWDHLAASQEKIEELTQKLDHEKQVQRERETDDLEIAHLCERLQAVIKRRAERTENPMSQPLDVEGWSPVDEAKKAVM